VARHINEKHPNSSNFDGNDFSKDFMDNVTFNGSSLKGAIFSNGCDYSDIEFHCCNMTGAKIEGACFEGKLSFKCSILDQANFKGAKHDGKLIPNQKIIAEARSLKGATLPDGSKYEATEPSKTNNCAKDCLHE
jgi:uncharacterized protein YjbI with pentapeptide repeats